MPTVGRGCHELRVEDERKSWRLVYAVETDAIVILEVFDKRTQKTPKHVIESCRHRLTLYRRAVRED